MTDAELNALLERLSTKQNVQAVLVLSRGTRIQEPGASEGSGEGDESGGPDGVNKVVDAGGAIVRAVGPGVGSLRVRASASASGDADAVDSKGVEGKGQAKDLLGEYAGMIYRFVVSAEEFAAGVEGIGVGGSRSGSGGGAGGGAAAQTGAGGSGGGGPAGDAEKAKGQGELKLLRVRTRRHELVVVPGEFLFFSGGTNSANSPWLRGVDMKYILVVIHDRPAAK